jgi:hypothetical protein
MSVELYKSCLIQSNELFHNNNLRRREIRRRMREGEEEEGGWKEGKA